MNSWHLLPAKEKSISEISFDEPKLSLIGRITSLEPLKIADDSGDISISAELSQLEKYTLGQLVRVIAIPNKNTKKFELELIQDLNNFNLGLYKQLKALEEK
jgi:hypothetical protein